MRLLPWTGERGQPAYLSAADGNSYLSRLADRVAAERGGGPPATCPERPAVFGAPEAPGVVVWRWRPLPVNVGAVRRLLRRQLAAWQTAADLADAAEAVLAELAANAVRHAQLDADSLVETRLERLADGSVRIEVHDADRARPLPRAAAADAESGRGLALVDALTGGRWGVGDRDGPGKAVWAVCRAQAEGGPDSGVDSGVESGPDGVRGVCER